MLAGSDIFHSHQACFWDFCTALPSLTIARISPHTSTSNFYLTRATFYHHSFTTLVQNSPTCTNTKKNPGKAHPDPTWQHPKIHVSHCSENLTGCECQQLLTRETYHHHSSTTLVQNSPTSNDTTKNSRKNTRYWPKYCKYPKGAFLV